MDSGIKAGLPVQGADRSRVLNMIVIVALLQLFDAFGR